MIPTRRALLALSTLGVLAACGGGGGGSGPDPVDAFIDRATDAEALFVGYENTAQTAGASMPTSGFATFTGTAGMIIDPVEATEADDIAMLGDLTLRADFAGTGRVTGTIDNITAARGPDEARAEVFGVSGALTIGGGGPDGSVIGDPDDNLARNEWRARYAGTLGLPEGAYAIDGQLEGAFLGNRVNNPNTTLPMRAIVGVGSDTDVATFRGSELPFSIGILGEN